MAFPCRERDLRVIRPFAYVREKSLRQFAESRDLPVIPENCPACFEAPKVSKEGCDDSVPVGRFRKHHGNSLQAVSKYRVIHKSLWDFRTRLRNNQDRHGKKEHINRKRISPSFFLY